MHRFYDPSLFDEILTKEQMMERYAPKVSETGAVLSAEEAVALSSEGARAKAVDVTTPEQFVAAGFSVHFGGPSGDVLGEGDAAGDGDGSAEEPLPHAPLQLNRHHHLQRHLPPRRPQKGHRNEQRNQQPQIVRESSRPPPSHQRPQTIMPQLPPHSTLHLSQKP